ncbi:MAG: S9 family peptidase [Gemmatimonadetes bacterium]|nr:S9 family peptidase [Gemmatimonadota bacterium]
MPWSPAAALLIALLAGAPASGHAQAPRRPLQPSDVYRLKGVSDPQVSPDGEWVAYVVSTVDSASNKSDTDVWMVSWDGTRRIRMTATNENESRPRWSPDGKQLAFTSARQGAKGAQVWLLDRAGGEAVKLTSIKGGIGEYAWSPDGKKFVFGLLDPDPDEADTTKKAPPKPIVVDRLRFKRDIEGYLGHRRNHLYLYDIASGALDTLTRGDFDDERPSWSPDGTQILFQSNRRPDADRLDQTDLFVIEARAGATPRQLTTFDGRDNIGGRLSWSPDARSIAFMVGTDVGSLAYDQYRLAVVPVEGGAPRVLTAALDRGVSQPSWTEDGRAIQLLVTDDREQYVARVDAQTGAVTRVTRERNEVTQLAPGPRGRWAVLATDPATPSEVYALENGALRRLTHHNDAFIATIELGNVEGLTSKGKDGAETHSMLIRPPGKALARGLPTILWIHGGPKAQDGFGFDFTRQVLAARGFAVVGVNYRGSDGRGHAWQRAIYADWGNKEVVDILGVADEVVKMGVADPARLGIGGWSYGGILTDYVTATDPRFKAASSGAGSALQLSMWGTDQYIVQYENELGSPWKNPQLWMKLSYPFFKADKIKTPTLYMSGDRDFNVPTSGTEQMYQALKVNGVEAEMVIYPNQFHGLTMPNFLVDRLDRYQRWFGAHLQAPAVQP